MKHFLFENIMARRKGIGILLAVFVSLMKMTNCFGNLLKEKSLRKM